MQRAQIDSLYLVIKWNQVYNMKYREKMPKNMNAML